MRYDSLYSEAGLLAVYNATTKTDVATQTHKARATQPAAVLTRDTEYADSWLPWIAQRRVRADTAGVSRPSDPEFRSNELLGQLCRVPAVPARQYDQS